MVYAGNFANEKFLLDALNRIARNSQGYSVLYVSVSKLKPKNRHPAFVKVMAKMFDDLVGASEGMLSVLSNDDFALLGKNINPEMVDNAVGKIRQGLSSDPLLLAESADEFAHIYVFPEDFVRLYRIIENMVENGAPDVQHVFSGTPLEAGQVTDVIDHLDNIDLAEIVKHQSVMRITPPQKFEVVFQEFFVAVKDLSRKYNRSIDLTGNKWLFLYLTQALDKKTMEAFRGAELTVWPEQISLNLNLSSIFSREFVDFAKNFLHDDRKLVVEVQVMDVLNSLNTYFEAKELLHSGGHKLLIDAMSPDMLHMLNVKRLEPDMVKIFWEPLMEYDTQNEELRQVVDGLGRENVVLAKCTDEKAVRWGVGYGMNTFQGPYIDALEAAVIRSGCPDGKNCKVVECLKRKRVLSGLLRRECSQPECLDKVLG